ncbi:MAG: hypothetical protein PHC51_07895 [bacterium]|nr:hypothetical protein [bacterium]
MSNSILLLDDGWYGLEEVVEGLEELGASVVHCQYASDALELLTTENFSLLLIDGKLTNGWEESEYFISKLPHGTKYFRMTSDPQSLFPEQRGLFVYDKGDEVDVLLKKVQEVFS